MCEMEKRQFLLNEKTKGCKMTKAAKMRIIRIMRELGTLTRADEEFILNPSTSEIQCQQRMIMARNRVFA